MVKGCLKGCLTLVAVFVVALLAMGTLGGKEKEQKEVQKTNLKETVTTAEKVETVLQSAFDAADPIGIKLTEANEEEGKVQYKVHLQWTKKPEDDVLKCCWYMLDVCDILFQRPDVDLVGITFQADLVDKYGNESVGNVLYLELGRETAAKCNFVNLKALAVESTRRVIEIMDRKVTHPVIQDDLT